MTTTRELLSTRSDQLPFDPDTVSIDDAEAFERLDPSLREWWVDAFGEFVPQNGGMFTPPQKEAIPNVSAGTNTLIASPTGSGKTLASFTTVLSDLFSRARDEELKNSVYCLYVSPLKSLANDIQKNLATPLEEVKEYIDGDTQSIRHAIRHGDTSSKERQKMLEETPHILNTTPETLAILLNSPRFKEKLRTVEYVIVDEIHSLADNKRGTHLSVSLERLENLTHESPTRVGCSATVEPLDEVARFLVGCEDGSHREYDVVDTRFAREYDIRVETPVPDLISTPQAETRDAFYDRLHNLVQDHETTIIFTNTRSGAESTLATLRARYSDAYERENTGCHHGSLSKQQRERVEENLKRGELQFVTTSTSLELGIDMQDVDLVVQIGSPKSIASLLQRIGRAGHRLGKTIEGRVLVLNRDELVECAVMAKEASEGHVDRVFIPERCQDVAAQHVYGMAINGPLREETVEQTLRRAHPYRDYSNEEYEQLISYLTLDFENEDELNDRNVYSKIWRDENDPPEGEHHYSEYPVGETLIGKYGRQAQMIYMTNIGTIPDSFSCDVFVRSTDQWVGQLDEEYLDTLDKGDVFVLGGDNYEYRYRRGSKVYVDQTSASPTVPRWFSERLPLSYDLGREILNFQAEVLRLLEHYDAGAVHDWVSQFPVDDNTAVALTRLYAQQLRYAGGGSFSGNDVLAVEEHPKPDTNDRNYYVQTCLGRKFNDGLSRVLAQYIADQHSVNVSVAVNDHGFALGVPHRLSVDIPTVLAEIPVTDVRELLRDSLDGTDFLKRHFRINATRSLLVLANYKGHSKSARKQQMDSEFLLGHLKEYKGFAVLEETYRELMEDKLDFDKVRAYIGEFPDTRDANQYTVSSPSPRTFSIASLSGGDVVLTDDKQAMLQRFHQRVLSDVGEEARPLDGD